VKLRETLRRIRRVIRRGRIVVLTEDARCLRLLQVLPYFVWDDELEMWRCEVTDGFINGINYWWGDAAVV